MPDTTHDVAPMSASRANAEARDSGLGARVPGIALTVRRVQTWSEYEACVALQGETWGPGFTETVPAAILKVAQRIGGVVAGAFEPDGTLAGFVFGMTGVEEGRLVHWSDMLAVRADVRGCGVGRQLKLFQRECVRAIGVTTIYWTFDPLVARNAHLNLVSLGAEVVEYVQDMYGRETSSVLHQGLGTDRFVVAWHLDDRGGAAAASAGPSGDPHHTTAPVLNATTSVAAGAPFVRVAIPLHIDRVQRHSLIVAARWRDDTRRAFLWCFDRGYRIAGFYRHDASETAFYVLARDPAAGSL
jgi:predicted GNAT superfamily acetyltransferase